MHIGEKIKDIIDSNEVNVTDFAKKINRSREYVYTIFKKEEMDTGLLKQIARALSVPVVCFFEEEEVYENNQIGKISGTGNRVQQGHVNVMLESQEREIDNLKLLLTEKDKVISEKERLIQILMKGK